MTTVNIHDAKTHDFHYVLDSGNDRLYALDRAVVLDLKDHERALVWIDGRFSHVLPPSIEISRTALATRSASCTCCSTITMAMFCVSCSRR